MDPNAQAVVAVLVPLLEDKDAEVRLNAVQLLSQIGPEASAAAGPLGKSLAADAASGARFVMSNCGNACLISPSNRERSAAGAEPSS